MCAKNATAAQGKVVLYVIVLRKDNEQCFSQSRKFFYHLYFNLYTGNGKTIYISHNYRVGLAPGKVPDARTPERVADSYSLYTDSDPAFPKSIGSGSGSGS
jgi:hypothetical protein